MISGQSISLDDKLRLAASKGQTAKILELIEAGASFEADREGKNVLHLAAHYGHPDTVAALLLAGCDPNTHDFAGYTALQKASAEGHADIVKQLLKQNVRVDHQDDVHGNTAVHEAAWKGYSQTLEALCKSKANLYLKNKGGFTPLHLTCQNGHNQSCRVLLLAGCKPDIKNNYGDTPLHTAARYGHAGVTRILISAQCKVSDQNKNGDTALHISVAMGKRKLTRILLEAKCDRFIRNKQGETASGIAERKNFTEVLALLNNPPTQRIPVHSGSTRKSIKKREKDSGTSSKESGSRPKAKQKKSKHGNKVHFPDSKVDTKNVKWSPYGCHYSPNLANFPSPNLNSLPDEPLKKGEQYFLDLSGNICKGPIGVGYTCYCAPFFQHVEQKLEKDKQELIQHIDLARADLQERMANLERRTKGRLVNLNQSMQQKLAAEQMDCHDRSERQVLNHRLSMERQQQQCFTEMRTWLHSELQEFETKHHCQHNPKEFMYHSVKFHSASKRQSLTRSKSEELLSENNLAYESCVTQPLNRTHSNPNELDDLRWLPDSVYELTSETDNKPKLPNGHCNTLSVHDYSTQQALPYNRPIGVVDGDGLPDSTQYTSHYISGEHCADSPQQFDVDESKDGDLEITGEFFGTVSNEMEKWYERRLMKLENAAQQRLHGSHEAFEGRIQAIEQQLTKINESFSQSGGSRSGSSLV